MNFSQRYADLKTQFEDYLAKNTAFSDIPSPLKESMQYALSGGGKRIRPVLFLHVYSLYTNRIDEVALAFAFALETLHNYSLVHDDLPCMDNDDFRRGKPTVHKVYGEDIATLCGDALLNLAYETVAKALEVLPEKSSGIRCFSEFARLSGACGMIGGQTVDINPQKELSVETLNYIYQNKTCNLFCYSVYGASILAGKESESAKEFGNVLGYIFQLTDDLLDEDDDFSILKIIDRNAALKLLENKKEQALLLAEEIDKSGFLTELVNSVSERKN